MALRHAMLVPEEGYYYGLTNRLMVEVFYNTMEDVLARARAEGRETLIRFAPDWGYVKLWQQFRDFRDWRSEISLDLLGRVVMNQQQGFHRRGSNRSVRIVCR